MAVIKCKMCGGDLIIEPDSTVAECEYCGSRQTVPTADNEKKLTLFARANRLRAACEFDKAAGIYETIVADFPEEAEAYWGLVLCKYGIEYVDDPATGKKIPTCHRSGFDSVLEDGDFEQACENADAIARRVYREEAKQIEELRKGIIEVSGKEEPYDIFICYKETDENGERTIDSVIAQDVYDALTDKGYRVFFSRITLEDKLGQEYEPYIFAALNSAKIMLAFGTDYEYFNAVWVKNEWSRYLKLMTADKTKHLIPCYKGIDAYDMPKEFARLQAQDMGKVGAVQDLLRGIEKLMPQRSVSTITEQRLDINSSAMVIRGQFALDDGDFIKANEYFERALDQNPQDGKAYLGKVLAALHLSDVAQIDDYLIKIHDNKDFDRAIRFTDSATSRSLTEIRERAHRKYLVKCFTTGLRKIQIAKEKAIAKERNLQEQQERELREQQERHERELRELWEQQERQKLLPKRRSQIAPAGRIIAASDYGVVVGLKTDGTVVAAGVGSSGQCNVSGWTDIVAVSAGAWHTVGLKSDGTVIAVGENDYAQCDVSGWTDIIAVSAGYSHTVGLKSDGTVVAVGKNDCGRCDVSAWTDIIAVSAGYSHTVGLKSDGTVVATKRNWCGQCDVGTWRDIVAGSAGYLHTVGLRSDGTAVAVGDNDYGQCDVSGWTDIVAVSAGNWHTVGLKSDGTVVAVGKNDCGRCDVGDWKEIVAVTAGEFYTVGLKSDGTVVAAGKSGGLSDIGRWRLFTNLETLEQEREEIKKCAEKARKIAELEQRKATLQTALSGLKGLFTGKRRREIEAQLAQIEKELKGLN